MSTLVGLGDKWIGEFSFQTNITTLLSSSTPLSLPSTYSESNTDVKLDILDSILKGSCSCSGDRVELVEVSLIMLTWLGKAYLASRTKRWKISKVW